MRRPVSRFAALCASLALAFPSYTLPLHAQERLNRDQAIALCVDKTGSQERQVVGACVIEEFVARGQEGAAQQAREELGLAAEAPAQQAPAPLSRDEAIQICVDRLNSRDRQTVGDCVADEFEADGQADQAANIRATLAQEAEEARAAAEAAREAEERAAAEAARQAEERAAAEAQAAAEARRAEEQAAAEAARQAEEARLTRDEAIQICVDRLNSRDRQIVGACVADEFEADGQADQAANIRATLAQEAEEARAAAEAAQQAEERAAAEAQAADEARQAEEQAAAEAARQAEEARLTRDEAIQICVDRLNSQDRQIVGACVADEFDAAGQTQQAERIRTVLAEEVAAAEAARAAQEQADAEAQETAEAAAPALTREAARDACDARLGREGRAQLRDCVADTLAADGQTDLAERVRAEAQAAQSRVAEEVAARGEPELTEQEQQAADQAGAALDGDGSAAAAADENAEGEVVEETVTAEDVRSSSEDFQTGAVVSNDDDDGLSRTQKIAIGALGALAVGALLSNRSRVVSNSGDRVVVQRDDGDLQVLRDDDALLRQAGSNVRTENFDDGSSRTTVTREDGSQIVTVRDASLRVLRRTLIEADGDEYVLIDDTEEFAPVDVSQLPSQPLLTAPAGSALDPLAGLGAAPSEDPLRAALRREAGLLSPAVDRRFSLNQVRNIPEVRALAPAFEVADVTFASGSAAILPEQARNLTDLARLVLDAIAQNPREVFLIEGHTDAVGDAAYNLALSDRRAESLALALNEYFGVPVENMVVQGYGEQFLKVPTLTDERANRRATVRQITGLLRTAAAN